MDYKNCCKCNKIFSYISGPILCNNCDKEIFDEIKKYLEENPKATASTISEDLKIPYKIIKAYIKDDRLLDLREKDSRFCKLCGDIILGDSIYCIDCLKKIKTVSELQHVNYNEDNKKYNSNGMHYIGRMSKK